MQRAKFAAFSLMAILLLGITATLIWMDRLFEEPSALLVSSIAGEVGAKSVLAIFAHPDDEQLITGLLIRAKAQDGAITRMITATKGEAGTPLPQISRIEELGTIRHAELLKNGYALGVKEQLVWDYPDGGLSAADFNTYVERLMTQMIEWQPDLIVTFWPASGFSDHADHKRAGKAATEAVRRLALSHPEIAPKTIAYILAPGAMMSQFGGDSGVRIVANQPPASHAMPGETWAKIRGWNIHASQRDFVQKVYGFPPWFLYRLYDKEHYFLQDVEPGCC